MKVPNLLLSVIAAWSVAQVYAAWYKAAEPEPDEAGQLKSKLESL